MNFAMILGLVAGILTTASFIPQVIKAWKSKTTKDLSLLMYAISSTGTGLWIVYGILIKALPVIVANAVSFALVFTILILKIRYK